MRINGDKKFKDEYYFFMFLLNKETVHYFVWMNINDLFRKQGQKRPLDTPKRMIKKRERETKVEGEI